MRSDWHSGGLQCLPFSVFLPYALGKMNCSMAKMKGLYSKKKKKLAQISSLRKEPLNIAVGVILLFWTHFSSCKIRISNAWSRLLPFLYFNTPWHNTALISVSKHYYSLLRIQDVQDIMKSTSCLLCNKTTLAWQLFLLILHKLSCPAFQFQNPQLPLQHF